METFIICENILSALAILLDAGKWIIITDALGNSKQFMWKPMLDG